MNECQKDILANIGKAMQNMPQFNKGYILGMAETNDMWVRRLEQLGYSDLVEKIANEKLEVG
ncbi:MAG: hypothetical protein U0L56_03440 [Lachnospiraceae bacterium]|nr:hypothetical protein [Lachnospiraceae bacterium]